MKNTKSLFSIERPKIYKNYSKNAEVILHKGDTYKFIKTLPSGGVTLIITSPPYNIGKVYEDKTTLENYLSYQKKVISELKRVLSNKGSICWEIGNYIEKSEVYPLDFYYYEIFKELGFKLRNRIIWHFGHGLHCRKRFSGRYETILWFTKTDNYVFNLDDVRVPAKYPGKRHYKGKNKGKLSGNPLGKNPSDVWTIIKQDWDKEVWEIPNVKSNHPEKTIHPCQFPIELVERCVLALTSKGDWVLDPYVGVGSALIAGIKNSRRVIGCDKEEKYISIARKRLYDYYKGILKIRPLGKPIYEPTGREKVSKIPLEWKNSYNHNQKKT